MSKTHSIPAGVALGAAMLATTSTSAVAQIDLTGSYRLLWHWDIDKRNIGTLQGDYTGLPLNDAARVRSDAWTPSLWTIPEYQCMPHPSTYAERGFSGVTLKVWNEVDPRTQQVVAVKVLGTVGEPERWIYLDGRPHPPEYAAHTWLGFSTGKWEGNTLAVTTTHLKETYLERDGPQQSDRAVVIDNWTRHGNYLLEVTIIHDPVYLTEDLIHSSAWILDNTLEFLRHPCAPQETTVEIVRPVGVIPHYVAGTNDQLTEFAIKHGLPFEATRGYAEAMYPDYLEKLKTMKPMGDASELPCPLPAYVKPQ